MSPNQVESLRGKMPHSWIFKQTKHFDVYIDNTSPWANEEMQSVLLGDAEKSMSLVMSKLSIPEVTQRIIYYVVKNDSLIERVAGYRSNAGYITDPMTILAIGPVGTNVLTKLLMENRTGKNEPWLKEGIAISIDESWQGYPLHPLACYLKYQGERVPLTVLFRKFERLNPKVSYPLAGSFALYLRQEFDINAVLQLYQKGYRHFDQIMERPLHIVEQEWIITLEEAGPEGINYPLN